MVSEGTWKISSNVGHFLHSSHIKEEIWISTHTYKQFVTDVILIISYTSTFRFESKLQTQNSWQTKK